MNKRTGTSNTFIVKVSHCQSGTWQGRITWADEDRTQYFRSALEMLRIMDKAVNADQGQNMDELGADHFVS